MIIKSWLVIPVAFAISVFTTLLCMKIAPVLGVIDKPDNLIKTHSKPTPYLGGIGIFAGILTGLMISTFFVYDSISVKFGLGILAASLVACAVGCIDDKFDIKPWQKIIGQIAAALILVAAGITPQLSGILGGFSRTTELTAQAVLVIIFVLGATNSLNLLDGLDGLCAGVTAIMTAGMLTLALLMGTHNSEAADASRLIIILSFSIIPGVLGFLIFNYHPAKIFMGDAGSLLLGLNMAALMIMFSKGGLQWWMASVVIFGLPILDTAVAFARRFINKRPLFVSDRGHIYDQMMDRGISVEKTVNLCYGLSAVFAVAGLAISQLWFTWAIMACIVTIAVSSLVIWKNGYLKMTGLRGTIPPNSSHHSPGDGINRPA